MYLMGTLVRPSSTESWTGMSSTMLMSWVGASLLAPEKGMAAPPVSGPPCSAAPESSVRFCSSSASAQSAKGSSAASPGLLSGFSSEAILLSHPARIASAQALFDADRVLVVVRAVLAIEHRNPTNGGTDARLAIQLDEIAGLHGEQLLHGGIGFGQLGHQGDFSGLDFAREHTHPAPVHLDRIALGGRIQHIADGLQRGVGHAYMDGA